MKEDKLIRASIYAAAKQKPMLWSDESLDVIKRVVYKTNKLIYKISDISRALHRAAGKLLEIENMQDEVHGFSRLNMINDKKLAKAELRIQSETAVNISINKKIIKETVMKKVWSAKMVISAGRIIRAGSLGVDCYPYDLAVVNEASRRAPLVLKSAIELLFGTMQGCNLNDVVDQALINTPSKKLVFWEEQRHPLDQEDDELMRYVKDEVSDYLWTEKTLIFAGRITAARSVGLKPSWEDIEKTRKADRLGRVTVIHLVDEISDSEDRTISNSMIESAIMTVESWFNAEQPLETAVFIAINEKIKQYVWISNPQFCHAMASLAKYGNHWTPHGEFMLVEHAHQQEGLLFDKITELLKEIDRKRLDGVQCPLVTWLWKHTTLQITPNDVSNELIEEAAWKVKHHK